MFFEELVKHAYIKSADPEQDEVVLLPKGCQASIEQNMVVTRADFEEILMKYRSIDPTSESILMTIGRTGIPKTDRIWSIMLHQNVLVSRYSALCNDAAAAKLEDIERHESELQVSRDATPIPLDSRGEPVDVRQPDSIGSSEPVRVKMTPDPEPEPKKPPEPDQYDDLPEMPKDVQVLAPQPEPAVANDAAPETSKADDDASRLTKMLETPDIPPISEDLLKMEIPGTTSAPATTGPVPEPPMPEAPKSTEPADDGPELGIPDDVEIPTTDGTAEKSDDNYEVTEEDTTYFEASDDKYDPDKSSHADWSDETPAGDYGFSGGSNPFDDDPAPEEQPDVHQLTGDDEEEFEPEIKATPDFKPTDVDTSALLSEVDNASAPEPERVSEASKNENLIAVQELFADWEEACDDVGIVTLVESTGATLESFCDELIADVPEASETREEAIARFSGNPVRVLKQVISMVYQTASTFALSGDEDDVLRCVRLIHNTLYEEE